MLSCPYCGTRELQSRGSEARPGRFQCTNPRCEKYFTIDLNATPKVLVMDIETLPAIATVWGTGKQYVGYQNIIQDYAVLSWSAKWLYDGKMMSDVMSRKEARTRLDSVFADDRQADTSDRRLLQQMWELMDQADVLITQNGVKFDNKKLNNRFMFHKLPPYMPFQNIDTLLAAQAVFDPTSAKLDYMLRWLGLGFKLETDYNLWLRSMRGEQEALDYMLKYNQEDVWTLEDYYTRIRAWIPKHPNFSAWTHKYVDLDKGECVCHVCRGIVPPAAFAKTPYRTPVGNQYQQFRCPHCGAVGRRAKKIKSAEPVASRPMS